MWREISRIFGFAADDPTVYSRRIEKDIRAKRKVDNGECWLSIVNEALEGTSGTIRVLGLIRQYWLDE